MYYINILLQGRTLGEFTKDKFPGELYELWKAAVEKEKFEIVSMFL